MVKRMGRVSVARSRHNDRADGSTIGLKNRRRDIAEARVQNATAQRIATRDRLGAFFEFAASADSHI
jgi:hypothetical protein